MPSKSSSTNQLPTTPASSAATASTAATAASTSSAAAAQAATTPSAAPLPPLITATANGSNHGTKVDLQAVYQAVIYGLTTYYAPDDVFHMVTGDFTRDELIAEFQAFVGACQNTRTANQQWRANIQTERAMETNVRGLRTGVRGIAQARFGPTGAQNLQFGFSLPKPRKKSAETKAKAVVKAQATRKKRNTMGSVQKKDVKSDVSVALVVTSADGSDGADGSLAAPSAPSASANAAPTPSPAPGGATAGGSTNGSTSSTQASASAPHPTTNGQ